MNSSPHLLPATCQKIFGKVREMVRHDIGVPFVRQDKVDVMCYSGNVVLERIFVFSFIRYGISKEIMQNDSGWLAVFLKKTPKQGAHWGRI